MYEPHRSNLIVGGDVNRFPRLPPTGLGIGPSVPAISVRDGFFYDSAAYTTEVAGFVRQGGETIVQLSKILVDLEDAHLEVVMDPAHNVLAGLMKRVPGTANRA